MTDRGARLRVRSAAVLAALAVLAVPRPAHAHLVTTGLGPVYDGVSHFAVSPEDVLVVLGLGALGGLRGAAHGRRVLFLLPGSWLAGGLLGLAQAAALPAWLPVASFLGVGVLVASDARLPVAATAGLALVLGGLHGYGNGAAVAGTPDTWALLLGIGGAVFVVVALALGLVVPLRAAAARVAVRVAGSWIAAIGLLFLGWTLRG